jgi:hypothetical protein
MQSPSPSMTNNNAGDKTADDDPSAARHQPQTKTSARVDLSQGVPTYLEHGHHVEGFIVSTGFIESKSNCSPSDYVYERFFDFPMWIRSSPQLNTTKDSILLSSMDDEVWNDFCHAFSKDLKAGDRNFFIYQCIAVSTVLTLFTLTATYYDDKMNGFLFWFVLPVMFMLLYKWLRPSLFDLVDKTVANYQSRFAEKGIRASVVYYSTRRTRINAHSRYLVFTEMPSHPRTLKLV